MKPIHAVMPPQTARLYERLQAEPLLQSFILIGGTALSLHLGHRLSEDLDFITLPLRLPRPALSELINQLQAEGWTVKATDSIEAEIDFINAGMDLADYSQSFLLDGIVKMTFFTAEPSHSGILKDTPPEPGRFRVASLPELCQLKAVVATSRSMSRDWLDLYTLSREHGFHLPEWKIAYEKAGLSPWHFENGLNRICSGVVSKFDQPFTSLLPNPPSIDEIAAYFRNLRAEYERSTARDAKP